MRRIRYSFRSLDRSGVERSLKGIRTGEAALLLTGAALVLIRRYRRQKRSRRLVYSARLSPGRGLTIRSRAQSS